MSSIKKSIAVLALGVTGAASAIAGPNPFVDCGIGAALFPNTHWAAVTSNVIWDVGTTAVTSATMSPNTCTTREVKAALFVRDNYVALAEDAGRGAGEHLGAALTLLECGATAQAGAITQVRGTMGATVAQPGYAGKPALEKTADLYNVISVAASHCSV